SMPFIFGMLMSMRTMRGRNFPPRRSPQGDSVLLPRRGCLGGLQTSLAFPAGRGHDRLRLRSVSSFLLSFSPGNAVRRLRCCGSADIRQSIGSFVAGCERTHGLSAYTLHPSRMREHQLLGRALMAELRVKRQNSADCTCGV